MIISIPLPPSIEPPTVKVSIKLKVSLFPPPANEPAQLALILNVSIPDPPVMSWILRKPAPSRVGIAPEFAPEIVMT